MGETHATVENRCFRGIGVTARLAAGVLRFHRSQKAAPIGREVRSPSIEHERLRDALEWGRHELNALYEHTHRSVGESEAEIFAIHALLLEDEDYLAALAEEIDAGKCAEEALERATERFGAMLASLDDPYLSARATDLQDVCRTVLRGLSHGEENVRDFGTEPFILVADDLTPSETVLLDRSRILGFVTFRGSANSHTAILSRAMGIPALVSVGELDASLDGCYALLDAAEGMLTVSPTEEQREVFLEKQQKEDRLREEHTRYLTGLLNKPAVTRGGHRVLIYANVGDGEEVEAALANGADGIGLLRSEFLYLRATDYPTEAKLFDAYAAIARRMEGRRTVIRTLDVGADKRISYFGLPEEENPALGFRAIRICLARQELFKTQLRAILRASAEGRLALMLPMIVSVEEVRESRRLLEECCEERRRENLRFDERIELGIMIETPAAVMMCEELAEEVDFFSVGTNDLSQYTLAADRQNPTLDRLFCENREPILRMIRPVAEAIHRTGGWIGICGELAADLSLTQRFVDLGVDELSVSPPYLLGVRGRVTECQ